MDPQVYDAIVRMAQANGIDPAYALAIADRESSFNVSGRSGSAYSSAYGLFQMLKAERAKYGGSSSDPYEQANAWGKYIGPVKDEMAQTLGRDPTGAELYLGHYFGGTRAARMVTGAIPSETPVEDVFSAKELAANPNIVRAGTTGRLASSIQGDINQRARGFGGNPGQVTGLPDFDQYGDDVPGQGSRGADFGNERFSVTGHAASAGANPYLVAAAREASKSLPDGYTAEVYSGNRPGDSRLHGRNEAIDVRINGPDGRPIDNYQSPENFRIYEQFAQNSHAALNQSNPGLAAQHRWGGYFGTGDGGHLVYGSADLMHQDLGGKYGMGMRAGSWENGLNHSYRGVYDTAHAPSQGMGPVAQYTPTGPHAPDFGEYGEDVPAAAPEAPSLADRSLGAAVHAAQAGDEGGTPTPANPAPSPQTTRQWNIPNVPFGMGSMVSGQLKAGGVNLPPALEQKLANGDQITEDDLKGLPQGDLDKASKMLQGYTGKPLYTDVPAPQVAQAAPPQTQPSSPAGDIVQSPPVPPNTAGTTMADNSMTMPITPPMSGAPDFGSMGTDVGGGGFSMGGGGGPNFGGILSGALKGMGQQQQQPQFSPPPDYTTPSRLLAMTLMRQSPWSVPAMPGGGQQPNQLQQQQPEPLEEFEQVA